MTRFLIILLSVMLFASAHAGVLITVVDRADSTALAGATVFDRTGVIAGITDDAGNIALNDSSFPLTVRCVGYDAVTVQQPGVIAMQAAVYELPEVLVNSAERPIRRVLCYVREYCSGITSTDTMQLYSEYMTVSFLAPDKEKGYKKEDAIPSPRARHSYARIAREGLDSIFSPGKDDDISLLSWYQFMAFIPPTPVRVPEAIIAGSDIATEDGKYGPLYTYRRRNGIFSKSADLLSNHKERRWSPLFFKLLGFTMDIDMATWSMSYVDNAEAFYDLSNFKVGTYNIHIMGRGRWFKKMMGSKDPIEMYSYIELYPVEITSCTIEDYKEQRKEFSPVPFRYPDDMESLSPMVDRLIQKAQSIKTQ